MSRKYKIYHPLIVPYFISFATVKWTDVFVRRIYNDIVIDSLNYCIKEKGLIVYAWCLMTSHIHLVVASEKENLQDIIRDFKKHTSKTILKAIESNMRESRRAWLLEIFVRAGAMNSNNRKYQFWQQNNQPIEIRNDDMMYQKITYTHNNPVVSGLVDRADYYANSSANDYSGKKGKVAVQLYKR